MKKYNHPGVLCRTVWEPPCWDISIALSLFVIQSVSDADVRFRQVSCGVRTVSPPSRHWRVKKSWFPAFPVLIQPVGLFGKRVAESMTHPDSRELSSLIINTFGSYELRKGSLGMNVILLPPETLSLFLSSIFPGTPPSHTFYHIALLESRCVSGILKKTQIGWKKASLAVRHFAAVSRGGGGEGVCFTCKRKPPEGSSGESRGITRL